MSLSDIVDVTITRTSAAVAQRGFSTPLVLSYHSRFSDRMRSVTTVAELEALGFCSDDQAHKDVSAIFAQPTPPDTVKIGRRALAFTQTIDLTPTEANSTVYSVEVDGLEASYTSDGSASVAEICGGLTAAVDALGDADAIVESLATVPMGNDLTGAELDGAVGYRTMTPSRRLAFVLSDHADFDAGTATVTGKDSSGNTITETFTIPNGGNATVTGSKRFARVTRVQFPAASGTGGAWKLGTRAPMTATDNTTRLTLTSPAGQLSTVEVTAGVIDVADVTTDPGIATDFAACVAEDPAFYGVLLDSNSKAEVLAAASTIESHANRYALFVVASDTACAESDSVDDVLYTLKDLLRYRTAAAFHPVVGTSAAAAFLGNGISFAPGSITWSLREVVGVPSYTLTSAQRTAVLDKNGTLFETTADRAHTSGGKVSGGEWIDVIHGIDWLHARVGERVFGAMLAATADGKLPFTDAGIHAVDTELRGQLKDAEDVFFLDAGWSTSVPRASSLTASQRRSRTLSGVTFNASPAGAIHAVAIAGRIAA